MALTVPAFTDAQQTCTVSVQSVAAGISTFVTLTPDQAATWTDDDLNTRVADLKAAITAFLPAGSDIQVNVAWSSDCGATVIQTTDTV